MIDDLLFASAVGGAAALCLGLVVSALPRVRTATRRAVLIASLWAAGAAPAVAAAATAIGVGLRGAEPAAAVSAPAGADFAPIARGDVVPAGPGPAASPAAAPAPAPAASPAFATGVGTLWALGTVVGLVGVLRGIASVRRLRRSLRPCPDPRAPDAFESEAVAVPCTVGFRRPVVVLPAGLAAELDDADLAAVLRHEGSHRDRHDGTARLLARATASLHWPDPLVHLAAHRLDAACEALADGEAVSSRALSRERYASCLVRLAERAGAAPAVESAPAIVSGRRSLTRRVEALLSSAPVEASRATLRGRAAAVGVAALALALTACCCPRPRTCCPPPADDFRVLTTYAGRRNQEPGHQLTTFEVEAGWSPGARSLQPPVVRGFSPLASPIDPASGAASPTFTDGRLTVSVDLHPLYRGTIAVFFEPETRLDAKSMFVNGKPELGIDYRAFQVLQFIPGTGNVPVPHAEVIVEPDVIRFVPAHLPLADGQYSVGVFPGLKSVAGVPLAAPVFHSFTVGTADTIAPIVVATNPVDNAQGVGAGVAVPGRTMPGPTSPDIVIRFTEPVARASVTRETIRVVDESAFVPAGGDPPQVDPAAGFPTIDDGRMSVVWRANPKLGGLPCGARLHVTVVGSDGGKNAKTVTDRSGNPLPTSYSFLIETIRPPSLETTPPR